MITKMIMVHFLVILHRPRKLQISQWKIQCLRMEDVIISDHSKLWHFWTETWDYLRSRITKSLLLNLSFFDQKSWPYTIETLLLISNIHLLSPQKWSQFVIFNIEKAFPRGQPQICPGFLIKSKIKKEYLKHNILDF